MKVLSPEFEKFCELFVKIFVAKGRFYPKFFDTYKVNKNLNGKLYTWDLVIHEGSQLRLDDK